jgi:hypothetical protein
MATAQHRNVVVVVPRAQRLRAPSAWYCCSRYLWDSRWADNWFAPVAFNGHLSHLVAGVLVVLPFFMAMTLAQLSQ